MELHKFICINCPLGCSLQVEVEGADIISISGNTCKRGEVYARNEVTNPVRVVTSTIKVIGGEQGIVSVKTKDPVPKDKIAACMEEIKKITVKAPVHIKDVAAKNIAGTKTEVVITKEVREI